MKLITLLITLIVSICYSSGGGFAEEQGGELLNLQFIYRHGDRTPKSVYPKDPYVNYAWPEGLAALTVKGKERIYQYAKVLKKRYANYIDNTLAKNVIAHSSIAKRCLETSLVFLAGLFPPKQSELWSTNPNTTDQLVHLWQPIAVETTDLGADYMLSPSAECYQATYIELATYLDPKTQKFLHDNKHFLTQLEHASGSHFKTPLDAIKLLDTITCEQYYFGEQFVQPKWLDEIGNDTMQRIERLSNEGMKLVYGVSPKYLRLRAGTFLKEMLDGLNHAAAAAKPMDHHQQRVYSYGTHDSVIATILMALGFFKEPPTFASGMIFELRRDQSTADPQVHLYYANVTNHNDIYPLRLNESETFKQRCHSVSCALKDFEASLHPFIPEDLKEECAQK